MTVRKLPSDIAGLDERLSRLKRQLCKIYEDLERLDQRIRQGEMADIKGSEKVLGDLRGWLGRTYDAESLIEQREKQKIGIAHDYAIDLEAAKAAVELRLDRLWRAGATPDAAGGDDRERTSGAAVFVRSLGTRAPDAP
ncbi:hypothetical protein [Shimia biformata]|uniref:hypothetical protein n=1 Tax=Shimia biformata TaxID=1294299 RepID=UPI001951275A|nr:hypothetical protein [Shimia biformata]